MCSDESCSIVVKTSVSLLKLLLLKFRIYITSCFEVNVITNYYKNVDMICVPC